jgi:UDP-galactopyranose mutase
MFTKGQDFDYIVVGAGLAGLVVAERIANVLNKKVLIVDERDHIGGNCYDFKDKNGIIIHKYGPHLFRTNDSEVFNYLSRFTDWDIYFHKVKVYIDGKVVPLPINFKSIEELFPRGFAQRIESKLLTRYGLNTRVPVLDLLKEEDCDLNHLAMFIYNKVYYPYSKKQWGMEPEAIDPEMLSRVPIVTGYDDRYFSERYQAVPVSGYSAIFKIC